MSIIISQLNESIIKDLNKCDSEFIINEKIVPRYENGRVDYSVVSVPEYKKRYEPEALDFYSSYIGSPNKMEFLAYVDGEVAGQLLLRRHWNRFARIEDIRVNVKFRRQGIGRTLLASGEKWARRQGFPGIMLETQNTNVKACRFYESYGFVLKGIDTGLYWASEQCRNEIALFWYLVFDTTKPTG